MEGLELDEIMLELLKEEVEDAEMLEEGLNAELGLPAVGVNKGEGDVD